MKKDAEQRLLDMSCAAIDNMTGNAARAKLGLSKAIREARDLDMERVLYSPWHDAAVDRSILAGYKHHRATGKYSSPHGTKSTEAPPRTTSCFPDGQPASATCGDQRSAEPAAQAAPVPPIKVDLGIGSEAPGGAAAGGFASGGIEGYPQSTFISPEPEPQAATDGLDLGLHGEPHPGVHVEPEQTKPWKPTVNMDALRAQTRVIISLALDVFLVNGRPIRQCTARECREFADHSNNKARFAAMCANGLQDDHIIGDKVSDEEANAFYEQAGFTLSSPTGH
jgi:hypothetical protein